MSIIKSKKTFLLVLIILLSLMLFACDPSDRFSEYDVIITVIDSETDEGLEDVSLELTDYYNYVQQAEAGEETGDYIFEAVALETERNFEVKIEKDGYQNQTAKVFAEANTSTLEYTVLLEPETIEADKVELVTVEAGTPVIDEIEELEYDIEMSKNLITNAQFAVFLNETAMEIEVTDEGVQYNDRLLINLSDTIGMKPQIGYNESEDEFYLKDWEDSDENQIDIGKYPAIYVTWYGAAAYCNWLSEQDNLSGAYDLEEGELIYDDREKIEGYRLPESQEWRFAATGGIEGEETTYAGSNNLDEVGWYQDNSDAEGNSNLQNAQGTLPVGEKEPNELGLYDMSGNLAEWTNTYSIKGEVAYEGGSWNCSADSSALEDFTGQYQDKGRITPFYSGIRPVRTLD